MIWQYQQIKYRQMKFLFEFPLGLKSQFQPHIQVKMKLYWYDDIIQVDVDIF